MRGFVAGVYLGVVVIGLLIYLDELAQRISDLEIVANRAIPPDPDPET